MKFVLETVSKCSGRLGSLSGVDRLASSAKFQTPALVLHTKGGSVPHLSKEVLHYLTGAEPQLMQYSLNGTVHMEEAVRGCGDGLSGFVAQKESVSLLVLRDPQLPSEKPRFMFGAFTPQLVLELVVRGVDIFDTSYPYLKTQQNRALNFSFDTSDSNVAARKNELDLTDACWAEDFTGFVDGCQCLACTKHTKAYTHHLYNTREMLAPILLMIHNLHHYFEFFKAIRRHVAQDTVGDLIAHINKHVVVPVTDRVAKEPGKSLDSAELKESVSVQVEAKRVKV
ncbi:hypothetical protein quinque_002868 [Culex quinquefasciatus]